jgi:hypothetical protein
MHVLDTLLADLSDRQMKHRNRLNSYLLKFDTLDDAEIESALEKGLKVICHQIGARKSGCSFFHHCLTFCGIGAYSLGHSFCTS